MSYRSKIRTVLGPYSRKVDTRKVARHSKKELEKLVWKYPRTTLAKKFGVSGTAITNWCARLNSQLPNRGYWRKVETGNI